MPNLIGHFDKQPHFTGWREGLGPTTPVIEGDKLYGRGVSDDGYAPFATIILIQILQELGLEHPRCVLVFEGDEESGSEHLPIYLEKLKIKIGSPDIIFALDSGCVNYEQLWLVSSLRGLLSISLLTNNPQALQ
jgi:acetylornithine deacetylase/succinyl-diaminopimelate desuccinylase-like protein